MKTIAILKTSQGNYEIYVQEISNENYFGIKFDGVIKKSLILSYFEAVNDAVVMAGIIEHVK